LPELPEQQDENFLNILAEHKPELTGGQANGIEGICNFSVAHLLTKPFFVLPEQPVTSVGKSC